jgi:hypothetical protein
MSRLTLSIKTSELMLAVDNPAAANTSYSLVGLAHIGLLESQPVLIER